MMSQQVNELAAALVKVQSQIKGAKIDAANPYFNSRYATLASVWESCRDLLAANGLCVTQHCEITDDGTAVLTTLLMHTSGQWVRGFEPLPDMWDEPQKMGSAITYARRYGLAAMVGVCPDDDDAEAATNHQPGREQKPAAPSPVKPSGKTLEASGSEKLRVKLVESMKTIKDVKIAIGQAGLGELVLGREDPATWPYEVVPVLQKFFEDNPPKAEASSVDALCDRIRSHWPAHMDKHHFEKGEPRTPEAMCDAIMKGSQWTSEYPDPEHRARAAMEMVEHGNVIFPTGELIPF